VAGSFFSVLKKESIKQRIYAMRETTVSDVFQYIEMFYNRFAGMVLPAACHR